MKETQVLLTKDVEDSKQCTVHFRLGNMDLDIGSQLLGLRQSRRYCPAASVAHSLEREDVAEEVEPYRSTVHNRRLVKNFRFNIIDVDAYNAVAVVG